MGNKLPIYTVGFGNDFSYKNWSLSIFMNGAFDLTKEDNFVNIERFLPGSGANYISGVNYWQPGNLSPDAPSPAYIPVNNHAYYMDASFWRIRDLSIGYTFDSASLEKLKIGSIKAYINARNLYTFSNVQGYNVEALGVEPTTGNPTTANVLTPYPSARVFSLGLSVQF